MEEKKKDKEVGPRVVSARRPEEILDFVFDACKASRGLEVHQVRLILFESYT